MQNVLIGGLITLAGTALVQILVIPWVQRRTRRLERWEKDLVEFGLLLEEEMHGPLGDLETAIWRWQQSYRVHSSNPTDANQKVYEHRVTAAGAAYDTAHELMMRSSRLGMRVALVSPQAPLWTHIWSLNRRISVALMTVHAAGASDDFDQERFRQTWGSIKEAREELATEIRRLRLTMRPPRTYPVRRTRMRLASGWRQSRSGLTLRQARLLHRGTQKRRTPGVTSGP